MRKMSAALALAAVLVAPGCESYKEERGRGDAPVDKIDDSPADVYQMPNGFPNLATKCVGPNKRAWVSSYSGRSRISRGQQGTSFHLEADESCAESSPRPGAQGTPGFSRPTETPGTERTPEPQTDASPATPTPTAAP